MPIDTAELISAIRQLAEDENINVTVKEGFKGAGFAFAGAFFGALVGGPPGLAVGGTVGSIVGAYQGSGKYKSVASIIMYDMTPMQKERLAASVRKALENVRVEDGALLLPLLLNQDPIRQLVVAETVKFMQTEMQYHITNN